MRRGRAVEPDTHPGQFGDDMPHTVSTEWCLGPNSFGLRCHGCVPLAPPVNAPALAEPVAHGGKRDFSFGIPSCLYTICC